MSLFLVDSITSSFSIILVNKYLSTKNFIESEKFLRLVSFPLHVIEFPLKKTVVLVSFSSSFKFLLNSPTIDISISLSLICILIVLASTFLEIKL